jgi:hypothetical protein
LLTYPAGCIEPDPAVRPRDAIDALSGWSTSSDCLCRLVPGLVVLPVAMHGVLARHHRDHWLARRCGDDNARDWWAATRQTLRRRPADIHPTLRIGQPLTSAPGHALHARILGEMAGLLA